MNLKHIKEKIRPEEALVIVAFLMLLFLRIISGAGWEFTDVLMGEVIDLHITPMIILTIMLFWLMPYILIPLRLIGNAIMKRMNIDAKEIDLAYSIQKSEIIGFIRGYLPFTMLIIIYDSFSNRFVNGVDLTRIIVKDDLTHILIRADELLFGTQVSYLTQRYTTPVITDIMFFIYTLHFFFPFFIGSYFYFKGKKVVFRKLVLTIVVVCIIGYVGYFAVPSMSPIYVLPYDADLYGGQISTIVSGEIEKIRSEERDCCLFPSLHIAVSFVLLAIIFKNDKILFILFLPLILLFWASTLYLRRHFFIDVIGGWITAAVGLYITPKFNRWWYGRDID